MRPLVCSPQARYPTTQFPYRYSLTDSRLRVLHPTMILLRPCQESNPVRGA